jgi:hypothetical protein
LALDAEHGIELLQALQAVTEKEADFLRVSFKAVLLEFFPNGAFQILLRIGRGTAGRAKRSSVQAQGMAAE